MKTENKSVSVAFSTQKGGVGKSTFTTLVASVLHYRLGYNVAIFDCDFPQHSLMQMRERDLKVVMQNPAYKKLAHHQFSAINKKAYPIFQCKAEDALKKAQVFLSASPSPIDVILFDLPGTVNSSGILTTLAGLDYIFSPITADRVVIESTLSFTDVLINILMKNSQSSIKEIRLFWNQVDGREKSPLYDIYEKVISELDINLMQSYIMDSKRFRKEGEAEAKTVFRSTLLPPDEKLMKTCGLDQFMQEFMSIIKL